jgi:parallel beta-helix repeat protein
MQTVPTVATPSPSLGGRPGPSRFRGALRGRLPAALVAILPLVLAISGGVEAAGAALWVNPASAPAGGAVSVVGTGFARSEPGRLTFDGSIAGMPLYRADSRGRFLVTVVVPRAATAGRHVLGVRRSVAGASVSAALTVTGASAGTPTPGTTDVAAPTPAGTPRGTPSPTTFRPTATPVSTPAPAAGCGTGLQSLIDTTPTGGTLVLGGCTYREHVRIARSMTIRGPATIDGRNPATGAVTASGWMDIAASNVTIDGLRMAYANDAYALAGLQLDAGLRNVTIENCDLGFAYVDVDLNNAANSTISNCSIHDAGHLGVRVSGDTGMAGNTGNAVVNSRIYNNATAGLPDPNADAAGLKASLQTNLVLSGNAVYGNGAPGLWCDAGCVNATITDNDVYRNGGPGIMFEISSGASISGNRSWSNGHAPAWAQWGWGAGILVSASNGASVFGNTVAWNAVAGISVISQDRGDAPGPMTNNDVHDNVVVAPNDQWLDFWACDWSCPMFAASASNRGRNERYWLGYPEDGRWRWNWNGDVSHLADWVRTPVGAGSAYLTDTQMRADLAAAGIPAAP